jgi:hypothetical protein
MSPSAIYSKSGKGVQEASGKTSLLSRGDRAVLAAFDGKMTVSEVAERAGKAFDAKFEQLIGQLDKDGFIRQVSAGAPAPTTARPGAAAAKPAAPAAKGEDLDFTIAMPIPKMAPPKPPQAAPAPPVAPQMAQSNAAAFAKAREEAEEKAAKERDRIKAETEAKLRAETEAKMRSEAVLKAKADAEAKVRAEAEAKVKAARDAAVRAAAEAKAKAEAEANAKLEAERARAREAEERARKEAEEAKRQAEEAKRKAEEEARKAREEADRVRKEAEEAKRQAEEAKRKAEEEARKVREDAERRAKEEAARRAKEEQERKEREAREKQEREAREKQAREAREQEERAEKERKAREKQERERQEREEEEREAKEKAERKAREKAEREQREREEEEREAQERDARKARERAERDAEEAAEREKAAAKAAAKADKPAGKPESFGDSLLADLDSFSEREDEDRKAKEEATRKEKEARARREKEEAERREREEEERREREEKEAKERKRREEEARREKEEEERREEEKRREEKERAKQEAKRKAREEEAAKASAKGGDDIPVSDDDLDMDDVKKDEAALSKESRRAAREREEREKQARREAKREAKEDKKRAKREEYVAPSTPQFRRPRKWGKPVAVTLFLLLVAGVGALHVMPISTAEYEKAASEAIGRPVKIGSANLSLYSGVQLKLRNVAIGEAKVANVVAHPEIGALFGEKKAFSRIELGGLSVPQEALGELMAAKVRGDSFSVARVNAKQIKLTGTVPLPTFEGELALSPDGAVEALTLRGAEGLSAKLTPKGSEIEFDVVANSFTVPIIPDMSLSGFAMKGVATRDGMKIESWGGSSLDGAVAGSANVRWAGGNWNIDGVMTVRGINAAVFAPALLSEGKAEGTGRFSFNDPDPKTFKDRGRIEGTFTVHKGVLGSFDLSRAIQTGGRQAGGRTPFTGMSGQGVFDKGAVALRNVSFGAGALNAGASADISPDGNLSGRIVADVRTAAQTLRATLVLGGTVRDPQVRN